MILYYKFHSLLYRHKIENVIHFHFIWQEIHQTAFDEVQNKLLHIKISTRNL
jgi:hypothetical protein